MAVEQQVTLTLHFYQPPRRAAHQVFKDIQTDPLGVDWTRRIASECYIPLAQLGILKKVSFDVYGTLDTDLRNISPEAMAEIDINMAKNGVADSYVHLLLPDQSKSDKQIIVGAGVKRFRDITNQKPSFFWPAETAIDTESLEVLAKYGFKGFFCSPNQIELHDGGDANNIPTWIRLPTGRQILALPFDRDFSHKLAFEDNPDDPLRADAYKFRDRVILPSLEKLKNGCPLMACTDGETLGHHMQWGGAFVDELVNRALPQLDIKLIPINEIDFTNVTTVEGRIKERSAWSCGHGGLDRWHGRCNCSGGQEDWKEPFNKALKFLNKRITRIVSRELGDSYVETMINHFDEAFKNPGSPFTTRELSLISAKVSALTSLTSCATFFGDPHVSGRINILHARVAAQHLYEAGMPYRAMAIWATFLRSMEQIPDPVNPGKSGRDMVEGLLGQDLTSFRNKLKDDIAPKIWQQ